MERNILSEQKESQDMENALSLYIEPFITYVKRFISQPWLGLYIFPLNQTLRALWSIICAVVLVNKEPQALNYKQNTFQ